MKVLLANPRGFCAGVDRAIAIVERALELFGAPIYVRHEVVHNRFVVENLEAKGVIFLDDLAEVPIGATVIFSAHGVSKAVRQLASERQFDLFDATCPLVTKVHMEVARCSKHGYECILIGHAGHPEVEGTLGQYNNPAAGAYLVESVADVAALTVKNPQQLYYVTQTTLSVDDTKAIIAALQQRFPAIHGPKKDDICYATQNRQEAVKVLAEACQVVLVVGSVTSSNSNRLRELAERHQCAAYLIDNAGEIEPTWLQHCDTVGVTAGASAPEVLVQEVIASLRALGATAVEDIGSVKETIEFALPKLLRQPVVVE